MGTFKLANIKLFFKCRFHPLLVRKAYTEFAYWLTQLGADVGRQEELSSQVL